MIDLIIGSDHRGLELKNQLSNWLCPIDEDETHLFNITTFQDIGIHKKIRSDYNDTAVALAERMDVFDRGILICGSGFGMAIQANRFPKVRAVVCTDRFDVERARQHNDMNVLCIGADITEFETAQYMIEDFLTIKFGKGRHTRRVKKLGQLRNV